MKPRIKPRNPFVACAKFRKAGPHEKPAKAQRRQNKLVLCKVVKQLPEHWHKRSFLEFASANASAPSGCGAVGSAPRLGRGGRWFETSHPDHFASLV
jgi:hypothetical protein